MEPNGGARVSKEGGGTKKVPKDRGIGGGEATFLLCFLFCGGGAAEGGGGVVRGPFFSPSPPPLFEQWGSTTEPAMGEVCAAL